MHERICSVVEDGISCTAHAAAQGMCGRHYQRWRRHGDPVGGGPTPGGYSWIDAGAQFNDWTVTGAPFLKQRAGSEKKVTYVPVACACGSTSEVQAAGLVSGRSKRCRPCSAKRRMARQARQFACPKCSTAFMSTSSRSTVCPACRPEYQRELNRRYMDDKGPEYAAISRHKARGKKYGLTSDEFDARLAAQDFRCAVCGCGKEEGWRGRLYMDHDHACCSHPLSPGRPACGKCVRGFLCGGCNLGGGITDSVELLLRKVAYLQYWSERRTAVDRLVA